MSETTEKISKKSNTIGKVVSASMDKSINVVLERRVKHPLYNKYISKTTKIMAHDQNNDCKVGDIVSLNEIRPISKRKSWVLSEIIKKGQIGE
jgi:small subunit ribosomal protein S17